MHSIVAEVLVQFEILVLLTLRAEGKASLAEVVVDARSPFFVTCDFDGCARCAAVGLRRGVEVGEVSCQSEEREGGERAINCTSPLECVAHSCQW
jgi:hypothetical protein